MAKTPTKKIHSTNTQNIAHASLRHMRIAPRKMRLVAHLIKHMDVSRAQAQLFLHERRPAQPLLKLLQSAIANAKNKGLDEKKLVVADIRVDGGAMLKRWMPRAQGRATPIQKKTSHITITLKESEKQVQSEFIVEKKKKDKKEKTKQQNKKQKMDVREEKEQETKTESKVESKTQDKGFIKQVFRRKSI